MKQFQKYGVAAAVASVATGVVATEVSKLESGDLAIIPYYTVLDGKNTGMHIINTTDSTQVVKVRLRRGADSKDALDFTWLCHLGMSGPLTLVRTPMVMVWLLTPTTPRVLSQLSLKAVL